MRGYLHMWVWSLHPILNEWMTYGVFISTYPVFVGFFCLEDRSGENTAFFFFFLRNSYNFLNMQCYYDQGVETDAIYVT